MIRLRVAFVFAACSVLLLSPACRRPQGVAPGGPKLVLFLAVDQLRGEALERFRPLWTAGFKRLLEEGTSFERTFHDHAISTTSPGHATLATGLHPSRHGIVDNTWFEQEEDDRVYSVEDSWADRSPHRLRGSGIGDWLKVASPRSKVFAVDRKSVV